jgi:hypothetical protein
MDRVIPGLAAREIFARASPWASTVALLTEAEVAEIRRRLDGAGLEAALGNDPYSLTDEQEEGIDSSRGLRG